MIITFKDAEQLKHLSSFINLISEVYNKSATSTINALINKLNKAYVNVDISISLLEDSNARCRDQVYCLYNICSILNKIDADKLNAGSDMYNKLRKYYAGSNVPWFLNMLKEYNVPAEYCVDLFGSWCSGEGTAVMAECCMNIQTTHDIIMTPVWNWVYNNEPCPDTNWHEEVNKYKEAING